MRGAHRTTCVSMLRAGLSTTWRSPWSDSTTATLLRCRIAGTLAPTSDPCHWAPSEVAGSGRTTPEAHVVRRHPIDGPPV